MVQQLRKKLGVDAVPIQMPIGTGEQFAGVIDLIAMQAVYFDGVHGEIVRREPIPAALVSNAQAARQHMLEALSMFSDELMERLLSETDVPESLVHGVIREAVRCEEITPVLLGSAYRNKGVQLLLDAVTRYLPSPLDRPLAAHRCGDPSESVRLEPDAQQPFVGMAFKIVDDPYGQLTFVRTYQGTVKKGSTYINQRTGQKERFSRIVRMHADQREEIDGAGPGRHRGGDGGQLRQRRHLCCPAQLLHAGEHFRARAGDQGGGQPAGSQ